MAHAEYPERTTFVVMSSFSSIDRLWFRLFSQVSLVSFPAGAPACVPAPQPRHQGFRVGFSLFPNGAGFTSESLFRGSRMVGFHLFLLIIPYWTLAISELDTD
jgi:hypothetical protein